MCYIDEMLDVKLSYSLLALYTCFNPNCKEITATVIHSGTQKAYIYICKDIITQIQYVHQSIENFIKNFKGFRNVQISIETSGE